MEGGLRESVSAQVDRLLFGHQRLGPFDDVAHAVDEAFLLRRQDELIVHLEDKRTAIEEDTSKKNTCVLSANVAT